MVMSWIFTGILGISLVSALFLGRGALLGQSVLVGAGDGVKLLIRKDKDVSWMETYLQERFGPCELRETAVIVLHDGEDFAEYEVYPLSE